MNNVITVTLTAQEIAVLKLICEDLGNKQIADRMNLSIKTIEKHRQAIYCKVGCSTVIGAVRWALARGIVNVSTWLQGGEYRPRPSLSERQGSEYRIAPTQCQ